MKRPRRDDADIAGATSCRLCRGEGPGHVYEFWSGQRERLDRHQLATKTLVRGEYSNMQQLRAFVCDACAGRLRRRKYLPRLLIWAGLLLPPLLVLLTLPFLGADRISMLICAGVTGVLAIPIGLVALFQIWQMFRRVPESAETDRLVLNELRWDKKFVPKGHELFTSEDYERMFV